jgi:hypothetical protein
MFEGPPSATTGFKTFSTIEAQQQAAMNATYNNLNRTNNNFAGGNNSFLKSPISNFGGGFPKSPITGFGA